MNGFELYDKMKAIDDQIKICLVTAYEVNYRALRQLFPEPRVECFIQKPIDISTLLMRIKKELCQQYFREISISSQDIVNIESIEDMPEDALLINQKD